MRARKLMHFAHVMFLFLFQIDMYRSFRPGDIILARVVSLLVVPLKNLLGSETDTVWGEGFKKISQSIGER